MKKNRICDLLSIKYPIIQAPMSWISDAVLAASVSEAGGLGVLGPNAGAKTVTADVFETAERLRDQIKKIKSITKKPFGINIMCFEQDRPFSDECVKVILEEGVAVGCLCGDQPEIYIKQLKSAGMKILFRPLPISSVEVAKKSEQLGVDAIAAVGYEGGGHLGINALPTFVLIPHMVNAVKIPVLAGGGIVDGRGMLSVMILGAEGVYMGTRFIATKECPANSTYKQAIIDANDTSTAVFTGRVAICRAFKTPLVEHFIEMEKAGTANAEENAKLHRHNSRPWITGNWDEAVFPSSAAAGLVKQVASSSEVIQGMIKEMDQILGTLPQERLANFVFLGKPNRK
jgi:NAD(P)H-dependent flavin oxidoreductase YrpB (nitropropane dioxygenase family)